MSAKILTVDDSCSMRQMVRITDLYMPTMDGLTLLRAIRERPQHKFTPVLLLTTEQGEEMKQPAGPPALPAGWSSRSSPSSSVRWCLGSSARPACARNSRDGAGVTLDPVLQIFFDEAEELLRTFEDGVLGLEQAPADRECLHSIFRAAHTLKGNSSMLGFERIAIVTHALEELLVRLRGDESAPSRGVIDALLSANDVLGTLVARARAHDDSDVPGVGALIDMLADHAQSVGHAASSPHLPARATAHEEEALYATRFEPPVDLLRRGLDPLRLMDALSSLGEMSDLGALASAVPPLAELDPEGSYLFFECRLRTRVPRSEIEACFEFVDKPGAVHIEALEGGEDADVHVPARSTPAMDALPAPHEKNRWTEGETQSIRVATEKVDRLVDLVGELVITQSMVAQIVHQLGEGVAVADRLPELQDAVAQTDRHARDLEERVMAVRMLPSKTVFGRLFSVAGDHGGPTRGLSVVVEHEGRRVALFVDELLGQQQFVIKSLDANFHRVNGVAGATILGDGRVALILDVPGLVALGKAA